jgi:hypothetical protein
MYAGHDEEGSDDEGMGAASSDKWRWGEESSGEELWEEWWEDEDIYSRIGEVIDLDFDPSCDGWGLDDDADMD